MGHAFRSLSLALVTLLTCSTAESAREKRKLHSLFCLHGADNAWRAQTFQPLINPRKELLFTETSFEGKRVDAVRWRHFYPGYDVEFDYNYDANGTLNGLTGSVAVPREWVAEADLFVDLGSTSAPSVKYYKPGTEDRIVTPEGANSYVAELNHAPIYKTVGSLPCADSFQEAEKMNATQK